MYGYNSPRRPELGSVRVMIRESEIRALQQRFPALTRQQVLGVMFKAGPDRKDVEGALAALARECTVAAFDGR